MRLLPIGTTGEAAFNIESLAGIIRKGERVTITGIDYGYPSYGYELTSKNGVRVIETGFNSIVPDK